MRRRKVKLAKPKRRIDQPAPAQESPFAETTINGRDGPARYYTHPLAFGEAYTLGLELAGVLTPVLGGAAGALFGLDQDVEDETIDLTPAAQAIANIPHHLLDLGGPEIIRRIFAYTTRKVEGEKPQKLKLEANLTLAYTGGNFAEMFKALWWVLRINYGPFGTAGGVDWSGLSRKLRTWLSEVSLQDSEIENSEPKPSSSSTADEDE
jgi:hypothetical protein